MCTLRYEVYLILCLEMSNLVWDGNAAEIKNPEFKPFPSLAESSHQGNAVIDLVLSHLIASHGREVSSALLVQYRLLCNMLN